MSSALILDTETTGIDEPDVVELAFLGPLQAFSPPELLIERLRFKPRKPISLGALATHHILDEELEQEAPWPGTWSPPAGTDYLIAHNVDFDWKAIGAPPVKRICTLALARRLWPAVDSHSLSALTYHFAVDRRKAREELRHAHGAGFDVELCLRLLTAILAAMPKVQSWERLWDASERARVPTHLEFGKYGPKSDWAKIAKQPQGMLIAELKRADPDYRRWLLSGKCDTVNDDPYLRKALEAA